MKETTETQEEEKDEIDEVRRGIGLYLSRDGAFARRIWISPFDLYDAAMWRNQQQLDPERHGDNIREAIRLVR